MMTLEFEFICERGAVMLDVGIDHVFASGAVVGRATTHEWGRPSLNDATDAKACSISIIPRSFRL